MIRFDLDKIHKACNYDKVSVVNYFYLTNYVRPPFRFKYNKKIIQAAEKGLIRGNSYLLHEDDLLENELGGTINDIYQYIKLASLRNYLDYKTLKDRSLDLDIALTAEDGIANNKLLIVSDKKIYFKYE